MSISTYSYETEKKYLAIHVDTTGINYDGYDVTKDHEVVALCMMVCDLDFNILDSITLYNASVNEYRLRKSTKYHNITRAVLDEVGLDEEELVAEVATFVIKHFCGPDINEEEYCPPIKCIGHNVGAFTLPFIMSLLDKYDLPVRFSINVLDTYSILRPTIGDLTLNQMIEIFGQDPDEEEYSTTKYKCEMFINIIKQIQKLWNKKVLRD